MSFLSKLGFGGQKYNDVAMQVLNRTGAQITPRNIRIVNRRIDFFDDVGEVRTTYRLRRLIPEIDQCVHDVAIANLNTVGAFATPRNLRIIKRRILFQGGVCKAIATDRLQRLIPEMGDYIRQCEEERAFPTQAAQSHVSESVASAAALQSQKVREEPREPEAAPQPGSVLPAPAATETATVIETALATVESTPAAKGAVGIIPEPAPASAELDQVDVQRLLTGVVTEPKLINIAYPDSVPVCTDQFLNISKDSYPLPWLVREIVQNFVDENVSARGTLNGVSFNRKKDGRDRIKFEISGNWSFLESTGLTSLHSGKASGRLNFAGGNGIGLKQTVLRFLRDYGVQVFNVEGEGWIVKYRLVKAVEINNKLKEKGITDHQVNNDWLIATVEKSENRGRCKYIVVTNNHNVDVALEQFPDLGVSSGNAFLENPDYKNRHGVIKWLRSTSTDKKPKGRLYINGQVMVFKERGKYLEDYWQGPEFVTIQVNNVGYGITLDRPAINQYELGRYVRDFIHSISTNDLIDQLKRSEHIWTTQVDSKDDPRWYDRFGCFVVIEEIVDRLSSRNFAKRHFVQHFADKKYLCRDKDISKDQLFELKLQGYHICPSYFEKIGVPKASSVLDPFEAVKNRRPSIEASIDGMSALAEKHGIQVAFEDLSHLESPRDLVLELMKRLRRKIVKVEAINTHAGIYRIFLDGEISPKLLFRQLYNPTTDEQKLLYFYRGILFQGLNKKYPRWLRDSFFSQGEYISTFAVERDKAINEPVLLVRNTKKRSSLGLFIEFRFNEEAADSFQEIFLGEGVKEREFKDRDFPIDEELEQVDEGPSLIEGPSVGQTRPLGEEGEHAAAVESVELTPRLRGQISEEDNPVRIIERLEQVCGSDPELLKITGKLRGRIVPPEDVETTPVEQAEPARQAESLEEAAPNGATEEIEEGVVPVPIDVTPGVEQLRTQGDRRDQTDAAGVVELVSSQTEGAAEGELLDGQGHLEPSGAEQSPKGEDPEDVRNMIEALQRQMLRIEVMPDEDLKNLGLAPVRRAEPPEEIETPEVVEQEDISTPVPALGERIAELEETVSRLDSLTGNSKQRKPTDDPVSQYLDWQQSDSFYGQAGMNAGYLSGNNLLEILDAQNQADIPVVRRSNDPKLSGLQIRLKTIVDRMSCDEDDIDDFDLVLSPTENQMAQLGLLRLYFHLATGAALSNDLFIFRGRGRKAINIARKAIGLHELLFRVSFEEALGSFIHEVAHNNAMNHDAGFMDMMESLFLTVIKRLSDIGEKTRWGVGLSKEEQLLLDIRREWEKLASHIRYI